MKKYLKKWVSLLVNFLHKRLRQRDKELVEINKKTLMSSFQSVGFGVRLNGTNWVFTEPNKIILGNNVHIGNNAYFHSNGGLIIGDNTHISRNVTIYTANHNYEDNALPYSVDNRYKPVTIGKNVWIGMNVSIIPGVSIGDGAIIGMGTVVNRNVAPLEIVGSQPAQTLKNRDTGQYKFLMDNRQFGGVSGALLSQEDIAQFLPTYAESREKPIVFIVGTGRSGSKAIVDTLNQHPSVKAFHENIRQFIRISTQIAHETNKSEVFFKEIELIFAHKIWQANQDQLLVHSDQRFYNLIPFLASYFSNSKFVHLQRDIVSTVKSMVARGWYAENEYPKLYRHDWAKYRLNGALTGSIAQKQWELFSQAEKCAWYCLFVNHTIEKHLQELDASKVFKINLEDLQGNLNNLLQFLGLPDQNLTVLKTNKTKLKHQANYSNLSDASIKEAVENVKAFFK